MGLYIKMKVLLLILYRWEKIGNTDIDLYSVAQSVTSDLQDHSITIISPDDPIEVNISTHNHSYSGSVNSSLSMDKAYFGGIADVNATSSGTVSGTIGNCYIGTITASYISTTENLGHFLVNRTT